MNQELALLNEKLSQLCHSGDFKEFIEYTHQHHYKSAEYQRVSLHYRGLAHFYLGQYHKARSVLEEATQCGSNVSLSRDLAACYYHLNEVDLCKATYSKLQKDLQAHKNQISIKPYVGCQIMLAKFLEEEGHIHKALEEYKEILKHKGVEPQSCFYYQTIAQVLRIKSTFGAESESISPLYSELLTVKNHSYPQSVSY